MDTQSEAPDNYEHGFASEKQNSSGLSPYLKGWRLYWTATGYSFLLYTLLFDMCLTSLCSLMLGIFLSPMGVSIVSTALLDITNELQAFKNSSWVTLSFGLGPLIGGGISSGTTWRWVFWLK